MKRQAREVARDVAPWIVRLARLGYASKGVVYATLGVLAARAALGTGGQTTDTRGAIERLGDQPFGQGMLVVLALGLVGYALWQFVRALLDPEGQGHKPKGVVKRVGYGASAVAYTTLAVFALTVASRGEGLGGGGNSEDDWTARLMSQPLGDWLVGLVGLGVLAVAANQLWVAFRKLFLKRLDLGTLDPRAQESVTRVGQAGIAARGVVLAIIGGFLLQAAWTHDPTRAGGIPEALRATERTPLGPFLLAIVALGVVAYGVYAVVQARYRRIRLD
ncbi:DUF1206 domain-containing protein [Deinococcus pimensis]|uniref:DUF1206 domain-containing protein n=1 Tax=Deinococcus pimensis TaxID=309888 RepID=UPI00048132B8|nr:DUF1206 domain-containing protein [Deinococcus pimensis]